MKSGICSLPFDGVKGGDLAFGSSQAYFLMVIMLVFGGAFLFMSRRALGRSE